MSRKKPKRDYSKKTHDGNLTARKLRQRLNSAGKGDRLRPVDREKWDEGWDIAFGKDESKDGKD